MKKLIAILLSACLLLTLAACGAKNDGKALSGTYTVNYSQASNNAEQLPAFGFMHGSMGALLVYDSRTNQDVTLTLDKDGSYTLKADAYCVEGGQRNVPGDGTGIGLVMIAEYKGTYTANEDGTVTIAAPTSGTYELEYDTYSIQMAALTGFSLDANDPEVTGSYTSETNPEILTFVPVTTFVLDGNKIVSYSTEDPAFQPAAPEAEETEATEAATEAVEETEAADHGAELISIASDDEGTQFTLYADGAYLFYFASYDINDYGTYSYADGVLTITDCNGKETVSTTEGENLKWHYEYSASEQLTGDYTLAIADLEAAVSGGASEEAPAAEALIVITSDDEGTTFSLNADGTTVFDFATYGVSENGTYTYEGGVLTVVNPNGEEVVAEADGDNLKWHYVSGMSDQLTGDYTVAAADLAAALG